ncbi:MAG TPA: SPOR domain-containing protein [Candidatus Deferrimicrobium sp.]|nr:SPOR domain-containing protein [Candidatus Deferrimicrobium sp.]
MKKIVRIVIGVIATITICLGLGWGVMQLGKLYLSVIGNQSKMSDNTPVSDANGEKQLVKLPSFQVYYLQLGVFQDQENAKKLANELQLSGIKTVVLRGKPNKVASGYFGSLSAVKAERKLLESEKPVEKSLVVGGLTFKAAPGDGQRLGVLLSEYASVLAKTATVFTSSESSGIKAKELLELTDLVNSLYKDNEQSLKALTADKSRIEGKPILEAMQLENSNFRQTLQALQKNQSKETYTRVQENALRILDLYQEYLALLQKKPVD